MTTLPYNACNTLITSQELSSLLARYGLTQPVQDMTVFYNAFVHRSYCTRKNETFVTGNAQRPAGCMPLQEESNERLEFLGDAVLSLATAHYLFERYPDENEGFLTKIRTRFVNGHMLSNLASKLGLQRYIIVSKQIEDGQGRSNKKILEDVFEAFLGALFLSFGFEAAAAWVVAMLEELVDFADLIACQDNFKDGILKYFQHTFNQTPKFTEMEADRAKTFKVCLKHNGAVIAVGEGTTKKVAENNCAHSALKYFGVF